ncbi:hypothetical protein FHP29_04020 [Nocardioides albidus]|uniref:Uncharacterized protein n=1 Tax=Nocardioides albidus TaxID=1517589 RepID=A0A5C4WDG5_9ACTN|nr:hypothetical protein [Nocardioides albidus]TNM46102.1 hypothetical protein FHP29_04020 [Nocardioides albidus]
MAAQAMGPTYAGGTQPIVKDGYAVLYLPDVNNRELIAQGEAPVFYYIPNQVRMARKEGPDKGDYLFNLVRFAGTGGEGVVGGGGDVAGGVLTFSTTGALPESTRQQAEDAIRAQYADSDDAFWGIRGARKAPTFRPAIIASSTTAVSNVSPTPRGFPALRPATRDHGTRTAYFGVPGARSGARSPSIVARDGEPPAPGAPAPGPAASSNLDPWYWDMQGQGTGSIDPTGTHAFSGLVGVYPAAILWEAFHGTASPLIVIQNYKLKVRSPVVKITIDGHWDRIFEHFSAAASGRYLWAKVDLQAEFNNMRTNGTITTDVKVDTTLPGAEAIAQRLQQKSDLVFNKFMEQAQKMIFDPPQPQVEAAKADTGGWGLWGVGVALKYRRDETHLDLHYEETQQFAYLQDHTVSSSLAGMYDEIKADPEAERKYFLNVDLDDWPRKLNRVVKPVAAWGDGDVEFMSVEIGYPGADGALNWQGHSFSGDEGNDGTYKWSRVQKPAAEVANPPQGWEPDKTFVKRKVHLAEPPSEVVDPYRRTQIQRNVIDIDPGPNGTPLNDTILEVRADAAGKLAVGPLQLGVVLQDKTQVVEAIFEATKEDGTPLGIPPVRFRWNEGDYDRDRIWTVFTGDPDFKPYYRYKVLVTVKGTLFEPGRAWEGPWTLTQGNGPVIVDVPRPDGEGVVTKSRSIPEPRVARLRALGGAPATAPTPVPAREGAPAGNGKKAKPRGSHPATFLDYQL